MLRAMANAKMCSILMATTANGIGSIRFGRHFPPGQGRAVDALGRLAGLIGGGRGVTSFWPGVRFEADLTDRIQRQMWAGVYECHVRECLDVLLEPDAVYFDVGAHIGFHAVRAAHRVGPGGRVFAFEADPRICKCLSRNLAQFPWAQAIDAAVWDHTGRLVFECSSVKHESGWGIVTAVRDLGRGEHVHVPAVSLDDWFQEQPLARWDAMKLDVEGSELAVLRGAQGLLERFHPLLILEINRILLKQAGISPARVAEFLFERGYRLFWLSFRKLEPWNAAKESDLCETLCLPEHRAAEVIKRLAERGFLSAAVCKELLADR
jgi:FkbM family methyltransferase